MWTEKWRLKLTSAKVEVEAELGNQRPQNKEDLTGHKSQDSPNMTATLPRGVTLIAIILE